MCTKLDIYVVVDTLRHCHISKNSELPYSIKWSKIPNHDPNSRMSKTILVKAIEFCKEYEMLFINMNVMDNPNGGENLYISCRKSPVSCVKCTLQWGGRGR